MSKSTALVVLHLVVAFAASWGTACYSGIHDAAHDAGTQGAGMHDGGASDCDAVVTANLVFYENVCVASWVECDGETIESSPDDRGGTFCDLEAISCDGPDRQERAVRNYQNDGSSCRFCTDADDEIRCTAIPEGCGEHSLEHVASGSAETGPRPNGGCSDAGKDADAGS